MKNKMLILSLLLVLTNLVKNINSMSYSETQIAFVDSLLNDDFFDYGDQLALRKLIELIKNNNFENFKSYFEAHSIYVDTALRVENNSQEADEKENKEESELLSEEDNEKTLLMFAVEKGDIQLIEYLISKGANVNAIKTYDTTPLSIAVLKNNLEVAKLLIERGADINVDLLYDNEDDGLQLLDILAKYFSQYNVKTEMVKLLIDNGYNLYKSYIQEETGYGIFEYALSVLDYDDPIGKEIIELLFNLMDKKKLNLNRLDLVESAIKSKNYNAIKYLLNNQIININIIQDCGETPLYTACKHANLEVVKFLIGLGADINFISLEDKTTPLMVACKKSNIKIIKELLNSGADIGIQTPNGLTAYDMVKARYDKAKSENKTKSIKIYEKIIKIFEQWQKRIAKKIMTTVSDFPIDITALATDYITGLDLVSSESLENIDQEVNAEKSLESAVKKKKKQRDSDSKPLDQNDPNYNLC